MKLFLLLAWLGCSALFAELSWAPNYDQAFIQAKKEHKDVLLILSQEHCQACWYMKNIVLDDEVLVERLEAHYVVAELDVHKDDLHALEYSGTPTLYFLSSDKEIIKRLDGVYNIKELSSVLSKLEDQ